MRRGEAEPLEGGGPARGDGGVPGDHAIAARGRGAVKREQVGHLGDEVLDEIGPGAVTFGPREQQLDLGLERLTPAPHVDVARRGRRLGQRQASHLGPARPHAYFADVIARQRRARRLFGVHEQRKIGQPRREFAHRVFDLVGIARAGREHETGGRPFGTIDAKHLAEQVGHRRHCLVGRFADELDAKARAEIEPRLEQQGANVTRHRCTSEDKGFVTRSLQAMVMTESTCRPG